MSVERFQSSRVLRHLLWIDSAGGLTAGVVVLTLSSWLSEVYGLPRSLLFVMGAANLSYGTFSGSLARRQRRPRSLLRMLVVANATWAGLCWLAVARYAETASVFGLMHLAGEGMLVGGLAALEWRERERLETAG